MSDEASNKIRSLRHDQSTFVNFINASKRKIFLFWLDYKGKLVRYASLAPNKWISMQTFVTHPWIAVDAYTGYQMNLNREKVFFPQERRGNIVFDDDNRDLVHITLPVFSLYRICLETVHRDIGPDAAKDLNIPSKIKIHMTMMKPPEDYRDYEHYSQINDLDFDELGPPQQEYEESGEEESDGED